MRLAVLAKTLHDAHLALLDDVDHAPQCVQRHQQHQRYHHQCAYTRVADGNQHVAPSELFITGTKARGRACDRRWREW